MQAIACAANASFSSTRSIWSILSPARLSTFWVAGMGPSPMQLGSTPATAVATMRASGSGPPLPPLSPVTNRAAPVVDPAGARGRHRAALLERGLELRDRLERRSGPRILVLREARAVREGHGNELVGEHAV